jgi:hypothetical protein
MSPAASRLCDINRAYRSGAITPEKRAELKNQLLKGELAEGIIPQRRMSAFMHQTKDVFKSFSSPQMPDRYGGYRDDDQGLKRQPVTFGFEVNVPESPASPASSVTESDVDEHDDYDDGRKTQHHYDDYDDTRDDMVPPEPEQDFTESPGVMPPSLVGGVIRQARMDADAGGSLFMRLNACEILDRDVISNNNDFATAPPTCPGRLQELRPGGRLPPMKLEALKPTGSQTSRPVESKEPSAYEQAVARRKEKKAATKVERKRMLKEAERRQQGMYSPEPEIELFQDESEVEDPDLSVCGTPAPVYRGAMTVYGEDADDENALAIVPSDLDSSVTDSERDDSQDDGLGSDSERGDSSEDEAGRFVDEDNGAVFIVDGMGVTVKAQQLPDQQNDNAVMMARTKKTSHPPAKPSGQFFVPGVASVLPPTALPDFPDLSRKPRFNPQAELLTGFAPAEEAEAAPVNIPSPSKLRKARQMKQGQAEEDAEAMEEERAAMYVMMQSRHASNNASPIGDGYNQADEEEEQRVLQLEAERDELRSECQTLKQQLGDDESAEETDYLNSPGLKRALAKKGKGRPRPVKANKRPARPRPGGDEKGDAPSRPSQRPSKPMPLGEHFDGRDDGGAIMMTVKRSPQEAHCPPHKPSKPHKPNEDGEKQPRKAQRPQRPSRKQQKMPTVDGAVEVAEEGMNVAPMARTQHRRGKSDEKEERRKKKKEKKQRDANQDENAHPNAGDDNAVMMARTRHGRGQPPPPSGRPTGRPSKPRPPTSKPPPKHAPPPKPSDDQSMGSMKMDLPLTPMPARTQRGVRFEEPEEANSPQKKTTGRARPRPRPPTSGSGVGRAAAALAEADAELAAQQEDEEKEDEASSPLNYVSMAHTLKQGSSSSETNLFATCSMRPGQLTETMKREKAADHNLFAVDHHVETITFDERPLGFEVMFFNGHAIVNQSDAAHRGVFPGAVISKVMGIDVSAAARVPAAGQSSASSFLSDDDVLRLLESSPLPLELEFAVPVEEDEDDGTNYGEDDGMDANGGSTSPASSAMAAAQLEMANTTKLNQAFEQSWDCPLCTFENSILFDDVCQMCTTSIPPTFRTNANTEKGKASGKQTDYRGRANDTVYALVDLEPSTKRQSSRKQKIGAAFERLNSDLVVAGTKARLVSYAGELIPGKAAGKSKGSSEAAMIATARRIPSLDSSGKGSCWAVNDNGEGVDYLAVVTRIYEKHNRQKLNDPDFVTRTLKRYEGREAELLERLRSVYCPPNTTDFSKSVYFPKKAAPPAEDVACEETEIDRELAELQRRQDELLRRRASITAKKVNSPKPKVGFQGPSALAIDSHASSMPRMPTQQVPKALITKQWGKMFNLKDEESSEYGGVEPADYSFGFVSDDTDEEQDRAGVPMSDDEEDVELDARRQQRQQRKAKAGQKVGRDQLKKQSQAATKFYKEYNEQRTQRREVSAKQGKGKGREHGSVVPRWKEAERRRSMQLRCAEQLLSQGDQLMDMAVVGTAMGGGSASKAEKRKVRFCTSEDSMYAMDLEHNCNGYSAAAMDLNPSLLHGQNYAAAGDLISTSRVTVRGAGRKVDAAQRELSKKSSFSLWGSGGNKSEKKGMWKRLFGSSKGEKKEEKEEPKAKGVSFAEPQQASQQGPKMVFNRSIKETLPVSASWVQQQAKDWLAQTGQLEQTEQSEEKEEENTNVVNMGRTMAGGTASAATEEDAQSNGFACTTLAISIRRWRCTKCTFDNELHNGECEMCENPREGDAEVEEEEEKTEEVEFDNNRIGDRFQSTVRGHASDDEDYAGTDSDDDDVLSRTKIKRNGMAAKIVESKKVRVLGT